MQIRIQFRSGVRRKADGGYNSQTLKKVSNALKRRPKSLRELARFADLCYSYTSILYNYLVSSERTKYRFKTEKPHLVGSKNRREWMIKSFRYSLEEIGDKFGVSKETIRQYVHNHFDYDVWTNGRKEYLKAMNIGKGSLGMKISGNGRKPNLETVAG